MVHPYAGILFGVVPWNFKEFVLRRIVFVAAVVLSACGTGQLIQTGKDTYSVSSSGAGFSTDGVKADVYRAANAHCVKQSREMVEVSLKTLDGALGRNPPSADLTFKCLASGDPEIQRRAAGQQIVVMPASAGVASGEGGYSQLKQLKELLDSGAITQKEFDVQKAKVLAR